NEGVKPEKFIYATPPPSPIINEAHSALVTFTVTVWSFSIITSETKLGTIPFGQGESGVVEFQLPDPAVDMVADIAIKTLKVVCFFS
ncbi:MAG: hypothetical protein HN600_01905, partial [Bacteroidetes bacterium]|nr:hypothetical protein [Bacteroidota bacterium]